jgi:UDP-N-acetylglucosamine/UDP-N-acetylgalactosamine 4-epimerase
MEKIVQYRILVTGGAGFIGSNIVEKLLVMNCPYVRIVDNLSTGFIDNISKLIKYNSDRVEFMYGDISDLEVCRKAVKDIDVICHQAALGSVPRSFENPLASHKSNVDGTFNMLLAAKEAGIKRFVYASSSSVYGDNKESPKREDTIGNQMSPYAVTKHIDELYANIFSRSFGMECIGLRYFNVFGPKQNPSGAYAAVIPKFILELLNNEKPTINGDGSFSRDFTYIDNVVQANILAMTTENNECFGQAINIGLNNHITISELYSLIKDSLNSFMEPNYGKMRTGDVPHSHADVTKAKTLLNYDPRVTFEVGITRTVDWFNEHS